MKKLMLLAACSLTACGGSSSEPASAATVAAAAPVRCAAGYYKKGNRCVPVPAPTPPPPTQTCWNGEVILVTEQCATKPTEPPPPTPTPTPDPTPPPVNVTCADGSILPPGSTCPSMSWQPGPLAKGGHAMAKEACNSVWPHITSKKADGTYNLEYNSLTIGQVYNIITWGWESKGSGGFNSWALDLNGISDYFPETCLQGVVPSS